MRGFMLGSGTEIERIGHDVSYWFSEDLEYARVPRRLRRHVLPWLIAFRLLSNRSRTVTVDIVEIHEPLAGPYALLRRLLPMPQLPRCAVLSYGLEERAWNALVDRRVRRGESVSFFRRIWVSLTVVAPAWLGLRNADAVLVPSTADRDYLVRRRQVSALKVARVWTGVGPELFDVESCPAENSTLLFLGSWIDRKGTPELIQAWTRLAARHPHLQLSVIGAGLPAEQVMRDFPTSSRDRVAVVPRVTSAELPGMLKAHGIFVLPSWFEGMPLSMLEAAAAGLPCVVTAICGNLDFFRHEGDGGLLVAPHDPRALTDAIDRLVGNPALRAALGKRARERATAFTWRHTAELALEAYRRALGDETASARLE
jgi:glycosyltransferase involved in cell wall biosynthesis